jgi:hypothetical protein
MPGYSAYFDGTLTSPNVREFSVGYGMLIGSTGFAKVDLISRDWHDFYVSDRDQSTRKATTPFGIPVDLSLIRNSDNIKREYRGVQVQGRWNPRPVQTGFTYTYSTLEGNDEGETANSGPVANIDPATRYPEFYNHARFLPMGYVRGDQRHKVRAWIGYDVPLPAAVGRLNVSLLQTFDSGLPYSAVALISNNWAGAPSRTALGYNSLTSGQYYFSDRGEYRTDDVTSTNLAFRYARNVALGLELFAQADVLNVLGEEGVADVTRVGTGVNTAANDASLQAFNPFTETPVLGQHYTLAANFGQPTSNLAYQTPRTYRFSLGLRF